MAQVPVLVNDYNMGPEGSVDGRIYNFDGKLTYESVSDSGESSILQYDKATDEISVIATNQDFDGEISLLASNTMEMIIFTTDGEVGTPNRNFYRVSENDFSDLTKLYDSGDARLLTFRFHQDHYMIMEQYEVDGEDKTNFKIVNTEGEVIDFLVGLDGRLIDFRYTAVNGHFLVAPRLDYIDGKSVFAYSIDSKSEVPITDVLPDFQDCGLIDRIGSINDNIVYYDCEVTNIYDLNKGEYINTQDLSYFVYYDKPEHMFVSLDGALHKLDKTTGDLEFIIGDFSSSRSLAAQFISTNSNGFTQDISLFDFETEELYTYPTDLPIDVILRFTGFASVPEGLHMVIYELSEDNGIIAKIDSESFTVIDSVYNVGANNRPVAYEEDIYFTHEDPDFGSELFIIDYEVSSTNDIVNEEIINLSPNPVIDRINISSKSEAKPTLLQIIDLQGRVLKTGKYQSSIDVGEMNTGIYFLKIYYDNDKFGVSQFVKE